MSDYTEILVAREKINLRADSAHLSKSSVSSPLSSATAVLPKIALPTFSSKVEDWPSFISIFRSLTDDVSNLSDAVKLHYLLSCLQGEAFDMVSHLRPTNDNFPVALEILTRRYENRRVLIDRFVDIILGLPDIHPRSSIRSLFLTPLISAQCALQNLDLPMKDCDYVFVSIAVRKLKGELRTLFERKYGSRQTLPTLQNLISFLEEHARCTENEGSTPSAQRVNQPSPQPSTSRRQSFSPQPNRSPRQSGYQPFRPIAPTLPRRECSSQSPSPRPVYSAQHTGPTPTSAHGDTMPCPYCNVKGHKLIACPKYNDQPTQGRWDFIKARDRCHRCLGPHFEDRCASTRACKVCGSANHHTSLHRHGSTSSPPPSSAHLLPPHLREQPRQRATRYSSHASHTESVNRFSPSRHSSPPSGSHNRRPQQ